MLVGGGQYFSLALRVAIALSPRSSGDRRRSVDGSPQMRNTRVREVSEGAILTTLAFASVGTRATSKSTRNFTLS